MSTAPSEPKLLRRINGGVNRPQAQREPLVEIVDVFRRDIVAEVFENREPQLRLQMNFNIPIIPLEDYVILSPITSPEASSGFLTPINYDAEQRRLADSYVKFITARQSWFLYPRHDIDHYDDYFSDPHGQMEAEVYSILNLDTSAPMDLSGLGDSLLEKTLSPGS